VRAAEQRLILFEVAGGAYAIPIADVLEVTESAPLAAIPGVPPGLGGVMNHHGDALPLLARAALFEVEPDATGPPQHVLVLADRGGEAGRLGLPVDRVVGLADAPVAAGPTGPGAIVERRPIRGRVVSVLDARRMLERAAARFEAIGAEATGGR
jgi:chemotaxis signal transduction protein